MVRLPLERAEEPELGCLPDRRLGRVDNAGVVRGVRLEEPEHLDDLLGGQDQSTLTTGGLELEQTLAQQDENLEDELTALFGRPVDLVARTSVNKYLREQVLADARALYAA